ncbi:hypothetical protein D3C73_810800 [compost metagenome]|uniref:hypothetical protein n=1 Tax=Brevundimonas diminuta TaxID=293 RepID=UPI000FA516EA
MFGRSRKQQKIDPVTARRYRIMMWARFPVVGIALADALKFNTSWLAFAALAAWYGVFLVWALGILET